MAVKKIESLNKHENPATNENKFNIEKYLNENWDRIKEIVDNNADELIIAQKNIQTLQQDNIQNKTDISTIKEEQETQNSKINNLEESQTEQDKRSRKHKHKRHNTSKVQRV